MSSCIALLRLACGGGDDDDDADDDGDDGADSKVRWIATIKIIAAAPSIG